MDYLSNNNEGLLNKYSIESGLGCEWIIDIYGAFFFQHGHESDFTQLKFKLSKSPTFYSIL